MYKEMYEGAKSLAKEDTCMKYYNFRKPLYLEIDAPRECLVAIVLQVRDYLSGRYDEVPDNAMLQPIAFASKSLSSND